MNYTSRCLLQKENLREFTAFCASEGWVEEPTKGEFEVLRMRSPKNSVPMLVYTKLDAKEHYTVHGVATIMCAKYIRSKRDGGS